MQNVLFVLIMMFGVFVQALAGFGGTLLSMPLGILLMGIELTKPVMTIVAWITGVVVVIAEWKHMNWKKLAKMTGVMLAGVLLGLWAAGRVRLNFLLIAYAIVVAAIGVKKLFFPATREAPKALQALTLPIAGLMQGLFVSGGSFLAVYAVAQIPEKKQFRVTVNAVWMILNTVMIFTYWLDGMLTKDVLAMSAANVIPTLAAVWLGGLLTKKVKQATFLKIIYGILIVSGTVLLITNL